MSLFDDTKEELYKLFSCDNLYWLFGAGISCEANIPLMSLLTKKVAQQISTTAYNDLYLTISSDLQDGFNIEHVLSHIGDLIALTERSKTKSVDFKGKNLSESNLQGLHAEIIKRISEIVRYGYIESDLTNGVPETIGRIECPVVDIKNHRAFVKAILYCKTDLLDRSRILVFTSNYDTLLEDSFILEKLSVSDGFIGTALGYWNPDDSYNQHSKIQVFKLHGSVDWVKHPKDGLIRNRYGVNYFDTSANVMIYPQATKYIETQRDPFAYMFHKFRENLHAPQEHVLVSIGYSFGDNHINDEIDVAMKTPSNKTTLIIFVAALNSVLTDWLSNSDVAKRIYVATKSGIYHGSSVIIPYGKDLDWWRFSSFIKFLKDGDAL